MQEILELIPEAQVVFTTTCASKQLKTEVKEVVKGIQEEAAKGNMNAEFWASKFQCLDTIAYLLKQKGYTIDHYSSSAFLCISWDTKEKS